MKWPKTLSDEDMLTLQKEWELVGGISSIPFYTNEVLQFFHEKGLTYDRIATYHKIKGR